MLLDRNTKYSFQKHLHVQMAFKPVVHRARCCLLVVIPGKLIVLF